MKNSKSIKPATTQIENKTNSPAFEELLKARLSRRQLFQGSLSLAIGMTFGEAALADGKKATGTIFDELSFEPIPPSMMKDTVEVPAGYTATVLYPWGEPMKEGVAEFKHDASNSAEEQLQQAGMHHDGMHFFPLAEDESSSEHGLLALNHEYIDPTLLHVGGGIKDAPDQYTKEKADKEIAAHGASVIEIKKSGEQWEINKSSRYTRRITSATPMEFTGTAAASHLLQTKADPSGKKPLGMNNNCANGFTPWGTYLTCEENFQGIFAGLDFFTEIDDELRKLHKRYGIRSESFYGWDKHHDRFDVNKEPHEPNRFGWIVEIDPFQPDSTPKKHTAMGRFRHENCAHMIQDDAIAFYSGDDSRFEYIYKFVPSQKYHEDDQSKNRQLLEDGTLYVAKFNEDGSGNWLPLVHGKNGLSKENGFADQAEVLVKTRMAADQVGATPMDRPEWIAVHPDTKRIYCTLTNNSKRKEAVPGNPRLKNEHGHIISWNEKDNNPRAMTFSWDVFALAGDPNSSEEHLQGNIKGDIYSSPDGIFIDPRGAIWIQTDISGYYQNTGEYAKFGNNQLLISDPVTRETKRFLTGPIGAEVTGITMTPDMKNLFVNIQHPGDVPGALKGKVEKTPDTPKAASSWPDGDKGGRPRSATIVITKDDGGVIGT